MCILMNKLFCLLLTILVGYIHNSAAVCVVTSDGISTFGPNCEYMCHCKGGGACDRDTGECTKFGCDSNWFGPGCQYRDLAEDETSRHLDNVPANFWGSRANDGDLETCSYTNTATAARTINPWWRVWLPRNETIWSMQFTTTDEALKYFSGFKVTVEYVPQSKSTYSSYYPTDTQLCYQHSSFIPTSKTIHVSCDKPLEGNQVRIQLASTDTQLVLCDVRINGGRNMAFMKQLTQSSVQDAAKYPPAKAVDGVVQTNGRDYCFVTADTPQDTVDWLTVDLGHPASITHVRITRYPNYDHIRDYQLYVSNSTGISAVKVHDDTGNSIPTGEIILDVIGQYVNITRQSPVQTIICEMEVYGDCIHGVCGYDCSKKCHCKAIEDRITGNCKSGCSGRWTGKDGQCITKCGEFQWGTDCTKQCGQCKNAESCDVETGYCPFGCADGYNATMLCNKKCPDGTYGENCKFQCTGNCIGGIPCEKSDGYCSQGCKAGYTGDRCEQECSQGSYGINCSQTCGAYCLNGYQNCHRENGACLQKCVSGWEGYRCDKECEKGFWYRNCERECGNCLSVPCNRFTGVCQNGCAAGYKTTSQCFEECRDYTYGISCVSRCSSHCQDICNKVNGTCNCKSGWKGNQCYQECEAGEWDENCEKECGKCLSGTCDRVNGKCSGGCMPGYKNTDLCVEECPDGKYGPECMHDCSTNCKDLLKCRKVDGNCEGCTAGKDGDLCDKECPDGTYGENCKFQCSGNCKGGSPCQKSDGFCSQGCKAGYTGDRCGQGSNTNNEKEDLDKNTLIVGLILGFVCIALGIFATYLLIRLKRMTIRQGVTSSSDTNAQRISFATVKKDEKRRLSTYINLPIKARAEGLQREESRQNNTGEPNEEGVSNQYMDLTRFTGDDQSTYDIIQTK